MISRSGRNKLCITPFLGAIAFLHMSPAIAGATTYTFVDLYKLGLPSGFTAFDTPGFSPPAMATDGALVSSGYGSATNGWRHALVWNGTAIPTDLHPSGHPDVRSDAYGVGGGKQVGSGDIGSGGNENALLWSGNNAAIDLNPAGFTTSRALGTNGPQQVGYGNGTVTNNETHALLWNSTNVAVDLNPAGYKESSAKGTDGNHQVGFGIPSDDFQHHALLWNGTNAAIDLQPTGFDASEAYAVSGAQQVGIGSSTLIGGDGVHALLWNSTNTATDLNPSGFDGSEAFGTNGLQEVGAGWGPATGGPEHALLWNGTSSAIDLGTLVPGAFPDSTAYAIDASGNVFGVAFESDGYHAVAWLVPEPSGLSLLTLAALGLRRRRSFRRAGI